MKDRRLLSSVVCLFGILVISVFFHSRLIYPENAIYASHEIGINDIWHFNYPVKDLLHKSFRQMKLPVWTDLIGNGFPVLAEGQIGTFNGLNIASYALFPTRVGFTLGYIISFFTCGAGTFLFARRRGLSFSAAFFSGVVFMLSGFYVAHISHYVLLQTASYFPLLVYCADLVLRSRSNMSFAAYALVLSQQIFAGSPQITFISVLFTLVYAVYLLVYEHVKAIRIVFFLSAIIFGICLAMAQILPTYELVNLSFHTGGIDPAQILFYKYPLNHVLTMINPFIFGNPQLGTFPHFNKISGSMFWENSLYIGILPLILILTAFADKKSRTFTTVTLFLVFVLFLLMLGGDSPLYLLLTFPPLSFFRFPSRYGMAAIFLLVIISGIGFDAVVRAVRVRLSVNISKLAAISLIGISIVNLFVIWSGYHPIVAYSDFLAPPESINSLREKGAGSFYSFKSNTFLFDEFGSTESGKLSRYLMYKNSLISNSNILYEIPALTAYSAIMPIRTGMIQSMLGNEYEFRSTPSATLSRVTLNILNIRSITHILSPVLLENETLELQKTIPLVDSKILYLYSIKYPSPGFRLYTESRKIDTLEVYNEIIKSNGFNPDKVILVEETGLVLQSSKSANFKYDAIDNGSDSFTVELTSDSDGILSIAKNYYPGWKIEVDGIPVNVFPVDVMNIGINISSGTHMVEGKFDSDTVKKGIVISSLFHILLAVYVILVLRSRKTPILYHQAN